MLLMLSVCVPLCPNPRTHAQATIWKETIKKNHFKNYSVSKNDFFGLNHHFQHIMCYCYYQCHPLATPLVHNQKHIYAILLDPSGPFDPNRSGHCKTLLQLLDPIDHSGPFRTLKHPSGLFKTNLYH